LSELQSHLKARLPDHMMPTVFVQIDSLPLTTNGKVDRAKLPAPDQLNSQTKKPFVAPFVAPRTPLEEELATIWQKLLKVEQVGINDNFFELGGHSLIATQLALRVQETFNVTLTLQVIFDNPTINNLAAAITTKLSEQEDQAELNQMLEDLKQLSPEEIKVLLETEV
jgi:acyl carrier protein